MRNTTPNASDELRIDQGRLPDCVAALPPGYCVALAGAALARVAAARRRAEAEAARQLAIATKRRLSDRVNPGPTPETRAKARPDVILALRRRGFLWREHAQAAEDINDIWQAFTAGASPRASGLIKVDGGRGPAGGLEALQGHARRVYDRAYGPWVRSLQDDPILLDAASTADTVAHLVVRSAFALTLDVVVDNRTLAEAEARNRIRKNGVGRYVLRESLARFAVLAGYL